MHLSSKVQLNAGHKVRKTNWKHDRRGHKTSETCPKDRFQSWTGVEKEVNELVTSRARLGNESGQWGQKIQRIGAP